MASIQRRRGEWVEFWHEVTSTDRRGNRQQVTDDPTTPPDIRVRAALIPDRSSRAEVPGQLEVEMLTCIVQADLANVGVYSRARARGRWYDIAAPPLLHPGSRHTRHWTVSLRYRPAVGAGPGEQVSIRG